jgi:hypothetical protein
MAPHSDRWWGMLELAHCPFAGDFFTAFQGADAQSVMALHLAGRE